MNNADDIARSQAHRWFARLRAPDCSSEERAAFERWRAEPRHADAYANLEDLWDLSAELAQEDPDIAAAVREARHIDKRSWLARRRWPLLATAASVLVAWLFLMSMQGAPGTIYQYATAAGEQRTIDLEDGSHVVMDTATRLDVHYSRRERSLVLRQGRVDFHVSKDAARPFIVQAGPASVTATGTQFQVRLDGGAGDVTLLEGQVVVASRQSDGKATLAPGERVAVLAAGTLGTVQRLSAADRANAEGWTNGQLVVQAWPISTLVAEVNRYGGTPIRLGDAAVAQVPVSGTFDPKAPEALALALEFGWPVRVERSTSEIVLYEKK
ncbi:MAG: FecR domain-containing protein [Dokdonella sp.]|nr:FecR domain-containing protein [Dokdonella sp.]